MNLLKFPHKSPFFALLAALTLTLPASADHNSPEALKARVAPEGRLNVVGAGEGVESVADVAAEPQGAEGVYASACAVCHSAGIAGAPRTGDVAGWESRIAQGMAALVEHAVNGFQGAAGVMPPKGGNAALSDDEVAAAVEYMVELSR